MPVIFTSLLESSDAKLDQYFRSCQMDDGREQSRLTVVKWMEVVKRMERIAMSAVSTEVLYLS
jgi:hypothetical protein